MQPQELTAYGDGDSVMDEASGRRITERIRYTAMENLSKRVARCVEATSLLGRDRVKDSHTYFIQRADGPIKIGVAVDVFQRMAEMQTSSPEPLRLIGVIILGGYQMERRLHKIFADDRIRGEWFAPTQRVLDAAYCLGGAE